MKSAKELSKKLKQIQKEIEEFQNNCPHQNQKIKFDDKNSARWHCDICDRSLRIPTQQELQDWIKR